MSMPTVQVIGIEKSFFRTRALDGITFDAGAGITQEPRETFYGGYAGFFTDPDGHLIGIEGP